MKVGELRPQPTSSQPFRRDKTMFVPETSGCYALAALDGTILYLGLATKLRARMEQHLDSPEKRGVTPLGRAAGFYWHEATALEAIERGWLNAFQSRTGNWPLMNKVASPLSR